MPRHRRDPLTFTPFHAAGTLFLLAGLVLAAYHGLEQLRLVPLSGPLTASWVSWSHIHFVTIGGFTQLLFGMLPQLTARKLDHPIPARWVTWATFFGLNGGVLLLWYGRGWGHPWAFDLGLYVVFLVTLGVLLVMLRMALRSEGAWDATVALYLLSPFVFLWGIVYAYGLFAHPWRVPGGWLGLREAHVHANAWGFLAFAAIGTLYDLFPRLVETDLYSDRLKARSVPLFAAGIFPLITGPWLGLGRSVTAAGLVLYAAGYLLYVYNLVRTYRAGTSSGIALSVLLAQVWVLGPAGFAPFVLFGVEWVQPAFIEDGALHFFFVGWALPVALAGLLLFFRNLPGTGVDIGSRVDAGALLPDGVVPRVVRPWQVGAWNLAVLLVGVGFFYQDRGWSTVLFGVGSTVIAALWGYYLLQAVRLRRSVLGGERTAPVGGD